MKEQIYIYLLNEGTDVWRPVDAELIEENIYKILSKNTDSSEEWQFSTNDIVECEDKIFQNGDKGLIAVRMHDE